MSGEKNKGFTLVEMVIVLSIFAILLGILIPSLNSLIDYRATRAAKSITTGFERLRTEATTRLVAEMKLEKKSDGYYLSYYVYKGKNGTKYDMTWTDEQKIAPARTKIEYKVSGSYQTENINGDNLQELKEGDALLFTIDRTIGGFRPLQAEEKEGKLQPVVVTSDEVKEFLEQDNNSDDTNSGTNSGRNKDLTYHDLKNGDAVTRCEKIVVSGRIKKRIITLEQDTGKVALTVS